jgi:hypothetical protein
MVHAGILTPHGGDTSKAELTSGYPEAAKERFIREVMEMLSGIPSVGSFPCGPSVDPLPPGMAITDLDDETKYPDFHINVLGHYRDIARKLDSGSEFSLFPICDPIAFALALGVDLDIPDLPDFMQFAIPNLPLLALKLKLTLPELLLKLPSVKIPIPPEFPIPSFDLPIPPDMFIDLYKFRLNPWIGLPLLMIDIAAKMPDFVLKLISLNVDLGDICAAVRKALFAPVREDSDGTPQDVVRIAATAVLARKVTEMLIILAMAKTIGTSPSGLVGQFAKIRKYDPPKKADPKPKKDRVEEVRDAISEKALSGVGLRWSLDAMKSPDIKIGGPKPEVEMPDLIAAKIDVDECEYTKFILYTETASDSIHVKRSAFYMASQASSCGMFARACLWSAGANFVFQSKQEFEQKMKYRTNKPSKYTTPSGQTTVTFDYFNDKYYPGSAVTALMTIAVERDAVRPPSSLSSDGVYWRTKITELPALYRGDIILIGNPGKNDDHVIVVTKDYKPGDPTIECAHGGQLDDLNIGTAAYILPNKPIPDTAVPDEKASEATQSSQEKTASSPTDAGSTASSDTTKSNSQKPVTAPKKGFRCTGIQKLIIATSKESLKNLTGSEKPPFANTSASHDKIGTGYALLNAATVSKGVAGPAGILMIGSKPIKLLVDGAKIVLGDYEKKEADGSIPTPPGKDALNPTHVLLPQTTTTPAVDSNNENEREDGVDMPLPGDPPV